MDWVAMPAEDPPHSGTELRVSYIFTLAGGFFTLATWEAVKESSRMVGFSSVTQFASDSLRTHEWHARLLFSSAISGVLLRLHPSSP